jgi:dolichyl-phosphate-mannose--protein O-mannosyl transferase
VTYGSVVKLIHKDTNYHLHSHNIAWGTGSGQQSVTATNMNSDQGSLWLVKDATTTKSLHSVGHAVKCGDKIRLEHIQTGKNLHSHLFPELFDSLYKVGEFY